MRETAFQFGLRQRAVGLDVDGLGMTVLSCQGCGWEGSVTLNYESIGGCPLTVHCFSGMVVSASIMNDMGVIILCSEYDK